MENVQRSIRTDFKTAVYVSFPVDKHSLYIRREISYSALIESFDSYYAPDVVRTMPFVQFVKNKCRDLLCSSDSTDDDTLPFTIYDDNLP